MEATIVQLKIKEATSDDDTIQDVQYDITINQGEMLTGIATFFVTFDFPIVNAQTPTFRCLEASNNRIWTKT